MAILTLEKALALPHVSREEGKPYLPLPNRVEFVATSDEPPRELTRTAFCVVLTPPGGLVMANNRRRGMEYAGGHIDVGETPEAAAKREADEELGCSPYAVLPIGFLRMISNGTPPPDWRYPHPIGFQQFFAGFVSSNAPKGYVPNDECLEPVLIMRPDVEIMLSGNRLSIYKTAASKMFNNI